VPALLDRLRVAGETDSRFAASASLIAMQTVVMSLILITLVPGTPR
jgi:hypothetical protein